MRVYRSGILILFFFVAFIATGCKSTPDKASNQKDSISVVADASDESKIESFEISVIRYFRRYNPTRQNYNVFSVQYGKHPVIVSYESNRVFIESAIPEKHALWLLNLNRLMMRAF